MLPTGGRRQQAVAQNARQSINLVGFRFAGVTAGCMEEGGILPQRIVVVACSRPRHFVFFKRRPHRIGAPSFTRASRRETGELGFEPKRTDPESGSTIPPFIFSGENTKILTFPGELMISRRSWLGSGSRQKARVVKNTAKCVSVQPRNDATTGSTVSWTAAARVLAARLYFLQFTRIYYGLRCFVTLQPRPGSSGYGIRELVVSLRSTTG